jgi:hypothetical protein
MLRSWHGSRKFSVGKKICEEALFMLIIALI